MDQPTFTALTGKTLTAAQASRLATTSEVAAELLTEMLGWPLDPADWDNQYVETGKTSDQSWFCSIADIDEDDLEDPDEVVGKTRLFPYRPSDRYLEIDPAIEIHAVKLVRNGITYKTLTTEEYAIVWENGSPRFTRYLELRTCRLCSCYCWRNRCEDFQLAIDATWAFAPDGDTSTLPKALQKVWAELMWGDLNPKKDIKSESITSHSYTRYDKQDAAEQYAATLRKYVGPNGSLKRPRLV